MSKPILRGAPTAHATNGVTSGATPPETRRGDTIVAVQEVDYVSLDVLTAPTGDVTDWAPIAGFNYGAVSVRAWIGHASSDGAKTVTVAQGGNGSGNHLILRTYQGEAVVDGAYASNGAAANAANLLVGPVSPSDPAAELVAYWAGGGFSGVSASTPVTITPPSSMSGTVTAAFNSYFALVTASEPLTASGSTGTRTATATPTTDAGWLALAFAVRGVAVIRPDEQGATAQHFAPALVPEPTLVATYKTEGTALGTLTTEKFTPRPGELIVVKGYAGHSLVTIGPPSAAGLTFRAGAQSSAASYTPIRVDGADVPAAGAGEIQVSATFTNSTNTTPYSPTLVVERWANAKLLDTIATNSVKTGTTSQTMNPVLNTAEATSVITYAVGDWVPVTTGVATFRSGAVANYARRDSAVNYWSASQRVSSTGGQILGMSAPTGQKWTLVGIELARKTAPTTQAVTPTSSTSSTTHPAPTLGAGPRDITPDSSTSSTSHTGAAVTAGSRDIAPSTSTTTAAHPAPVVAAGGRDVAPAAQVAVTAHEPPAVTAGTRAVTADAQTATTGHYPPALGIGPAAVTVEASTATAGHPEPAVVRGPRGIAPDAAQAATQHGAPALAVGPGVVRPPAQAVTAEHAAPSVSRGPRNIAPDRPTRSNLCTAPTCAPNAGAWVGNGARATGITGFGATTTTGYQTGSDGVAITPAFTPAAGTVYAASAGIKAAAAGTARVWFMWYGASGFIGYSASRLRAFAAGEVARIGVADAAPAGATTGYLRVDQLANALVTQALIEQSATVSPYGDGDTAGWRWAGTAGASASSLDTVEANTTHPAPTVGRGAKAIAPDVSSSLAAHPAPNVGAGPRNVTPDASTSSSVHPAPTVTPRAANIAPATSSPTAQYPEPVVGRGTVQTTPLSSTSATAHPTPVVGRGARGIAPDAAPASTTHAAPALSMAVTPSSSAARVEYPEPAVRRGTVELRPSAASAATQHPGPAVAPGPADVRPAGRTVQSGHPEPTIAPGPVELLADVATVTAEAAGEPVLDTGPVELRPDEQNLDIAHGVVEVLVGPVDVAPGDHRAAVTHLPAAVRRGPVELLLGETARAAAQHPAPAVGRGAITVRPAQHRPSATHGVVEVLVGPVDVAPELATARTGAAAPAVSRGAVVITPERIEGGVEHPLPLVVVGAFVLARPGRLGVSSGPDRGRSVVDEPTSPRLEVTDGEHV